MREIRKLKVGLAAVMCTPFRGDKEANYARNIQDLENLASDLDVSLKVIHQGIYSDEHSVQAATALEVWGADFVILQSASFAGGTFIYPFADKFKYLGLWSVPEGAPTLEGGLPLNSFTAMNMYNSILRTFPGKPKGPIKWFLGDPGQPLFDSRFESTVQALRALLNLQGSTIGLVGGVAPGFDNLIVDKEVLYDRLRITVSEVSYSSLMEKVDQADTKKAQKLAEEIRESATRFDQNLENSLQKSGRVNLALQLLAAEKGLDAIALSCWPQFQSDYHFAVCSVMGNLNTRGLIAACEGDVTSAINMLMLHYMTNSSVVTLMDMATIDPSDDSVLLWHCGPTSPALADEKGTTMQSLWLFDGPKGDRTGLHNNLVLKPGLVSVMGFNTKFDQMLIMNGIMDNTKPSYTGSRGWCRSIKLNGLPVSTIDLVQTLMVSGYQHHYPLVYGDLSASGQELCSWLGIEPINSEPYTTYIK